MTSFVAPLFTLRLRAAGLLARLVARFPRLRRTLPAESLAASLPHRHDSPAVAEAGESGMPASSAPHDLYRVWVCMKHRTDGRPSCAVGNGHGTAAELLAALQTRVAVANQNDKGADPTCVPGARHRIDVRPSGCLDLCDHGLVAIAHTGPAATRAKPPKGKLDRLLNPRLARFTDATPADADALLETLITARQSQGHR